MTDLQKRLRIRAHWAEKFEVTRDEFWVLHEHIERLQRQLDDAQEFMRGVARNLVAAAQ